MDTAAAKARPSILSCQSTAASAVQVTAAEKVGLANMVVTFEDERVAIGVMADAALMKVAAALDDDEDDDEEKEDDDDEEKEEETVVVVMFEEAPPCDDKATTAGRDAAVG